MKKEQAALSIENLEYQINEYKKDKEVKRRCRNDKKQYIEKRAAKAEEAAKLGDTKMLYRIVKDLSGKATQNPHKDGQWEESKDA